MKRKLRSAHVSGFTATKLYPSTSPNQVLTHAARAVATGKGSDQSNH